MIGVALSQKLFANLERRTWRKYVEFVENEARTLVQYSKDFDINSATNKTVEWTKTSTDSYAYTCQSM